MKSLKFKAAKGTMGGKKASDAKGVQSADGEIEATLTQDDPGPSGGELARKLFDLTYEEAFQCVQCGYCLPACPTYASMGKETASPRGRINLVKLAAEGKIDIVEHLAEPIDLCLGCRACEPACPVGVPYGHILEAAKEVIADARQYKLAEVDSVGVGTTHNDDEKTKLKRGARWKRKLGNAAFKQLFPYPRRMRLLGHIVWLYQTMRLDTLLRRTQLLQKVSEPLAALEQVLSPLESPLRRQREGTATPAKGSKRGTVAFFSGCIMDAVMHRTNRLSMELLALVGCEVVIPQRQNCCGALHAHQGLKQDAIQLAKANIAAFERSGADYYVNNAGGCGAMLCEYDKLFVDDAEWLQRAETFASKSRDITVILVDFGPLPYIENWNGGNITYQDSCHLRNVQGVSEQPRMLLQSIPGAKFIELEDSDRCCASGGIYNIEHYDESMKILDQKMNQVNETQATTVVTTNPGCLLQMRLGIEREGNATQMRALHIVEVLAEACGLS